jgi:signal transduction histidine kinase
VSRAVVTLLAALLCAIVILLAFALRLLGEQRVVLEEAVRGAEARAMELLASDVEQTILGIVRVPQQALRNLPASDITDMRLAELRETAPLVRHLLVLEGKRRVAQADPKAATSTSSALPEWLVQRAIAEATDSHAALQGRYFFLEVIDGALELFGLAPLADGNPPTTALLLGIDLASLQQAYLEPRFAAFRSEQGGSVVLAGPDASWDDAALNWPIGKALPGWMLVYTPDPHEETDRLAREQATLVAITTAAVLAILSATFAVWSELRRERAIVALRKRFVANVSHEFKTPLALIRMYAETLSLGRIKDAERQHKYLATILRESERLTDMINNVLDFGRAAQGAALKPQGHDLLATVSQVLDDYRPRIDERGITLETELASPFVAVAHDRAAVTQILVNLIDNVLKYAASGGVMRVGLRRLGDVAELSVADAGPGIPPGDRERVRLPFERGVSAAGIGGSGLGLALVEQMVQAHGGRLELRTSTGGQGLTVAIHLPIGECRHERA